MSRSIVPLERSSSGSVRLTRAERRAVELELALQQSQRLLAENAESIAEREARAKEAEAKADQLVATLEAAPQKRSSWFSWLTRRHRPTAAPETSQSA